VSAPSLLGGHNALDGRAWPHGPAEAFSTGYARRGGTGAAGAFAVAGVGAGTGAEPSADPLDPIDRLALSLAALCGEAVDPLAIVAGLEAEGHNDRLAQERHGLPDLFALAEELYRRVPRSGQIQARLTAGPAGERVGAIARPLLRGSLFAVPALCGLALLPPAGRTGDQVRLGIAVIQILAWGYGQGIAHAAYARLNAGDRPAARDLLRQATLWALFSEIALFGTLALVTGSAPSVVLPTATALGYCLAAVPALVLGAELQLAAVLAPVGLATLAWALGLHDLWGGEGAGVIAAGAVLGALWLAWRLTRTPRTKARTKLWTKWRSRSGAKKGIKPQPSARGPGWVAGTAPQALYGSCVGIWLLLVLVGPIGATQAPQLHAAMTLTLSMGAAEWHYAWYRQAMRRSLAANHELAGFARRAVAVLVLALLRQALTTAVLAGSIYTLLDRQTGGIGCYLFALALGPGLLAATVVRAVAARGLLALTVLALGATMVAQPSGGAVAAAEIACVYAVVLAVAAAWMSTRPWTSL
jgi:hypothetical protein